MASYWSLRFAIADYRSKSDSILERERATRLAPGNSWYWTSLATMQQQHGLDAIPAFRAAVEVSPRNWKAWMDLGLQEEINGNYAAAERDLLHATEVSREYIPRWTMANYYFRRNDPERFWPWARKSLELSSGELQAIFRMCWTLNRGEDPQIHNVIPERPAVLDQYLGWLTNESKFEAASKVVDRLPKEITPNVRYLWDHEIDAGNFGAAASVWNRMLMNRLPAPAGIVNSRFEAAPLNTGFDWRLVPQEGVSLRWTSSGLRVVFSGSEPELCMPLSQYVLLDPNREYQIVSEYESSGLRPGAGLAWRVFSGDGAVEYTKDPPDLTASPAGRSSMTFRTPPGISGGRLILVYRRSVGATRIEGWLQLRQVTLRPAR